MIYWLKSLGNANRPTEWYLLAAALLLVGIWEVFLPKRALRGALAARLGSHATLHLLGGLLTYLLIPVSGLAFALACERTTWGLAIAQLLPWWLRFAAGILVLDLGRYWSHYAFHAIRPLWRIHAIHHSDIEFDMTTGIRHHPLELPLTSLADFAVIALCAVPPTAVFLLSCAGVMHAFFSHANAALPKRFERCLRLFLITPEFHEIHHSIGFAEQNANLGNILPWWDHLFGTAIEPAPERSLRFGLDEAQTQQRLNVGRLLTHPFRTE